MAYKYEMHTHNSISSQCGRFTPRELVETFAQQGYAGIFTTESGVVVPVFEARAPFKLYLSDLDAQELRNLVDDREQLDKYPGLKVGAMDQATNDAGNWE